MSDVDKQLAELVEAGYTIYSRQGETTPNFWKPHAETPDGWVWEGHARYIAPSDYIDDCTREAVEKGYEHLLEKRYLAELEAFVRKISEMEVDDEIQDHVAEAKTLLGK